MPSRRLSRAPDPPAARIRHGLMKELPTFLNRLPFITSMQLPLQPVELPTSTRKNAGRPLSQARVTSAPANRGGDGGGENVSPAAESIFPRRGDARQSGAGKRPLAKAFSNACIAELWLLPRRPGLRLVYRGQRDPIRDVSIRIPRPGKSAPGIQLPRTASKLSLCKNHAANPNASRHGRMPS